MFMGGLVPRETTRITEKCSFIRLVVKSSTLEGSNSEIETHVYALLLLRHVQISPIHKSSANLGISLEGNQAGPDGILRILRIQLTQNAGTNVVDQAVDLETAFVDRVQNHALLGHHI